MKVYRQWLPCKLNSLYNFMPVFMQLAHLFFHGLKMCMWFGFNPAVNFCHFSTLLTFFAGATSTSPKFDLYFFLQFSNIKIFVPLFSETVRPRRLKLGTHMDSEQMCRVYRNQAAAAYSSLYFLIFLSLQFSNIKIFRHTFLRNCEA